MQNLGPESYSVHCSNIDFSTGHKYLMSTDTWAERDWLTTSILKLCLTADAEINHVFHLPTHEASEGFLQHVNLMLEFIIN